MSDRWQPDWDAYVRYNIEDAKLGDRIRELYHAELAKWRRELLPMFGSAWENMMYYYRSKETKNAQIR